eukprot:scaffold7977_cov77-Cyclotella_meneghiniana.AAC.2
MYGTIIPYLTLAQSLPHTILAQISFGFLHHSIILSYASSQFVSVLGFDRQLTKEERGKTCPAGKASEEEESMFRSWHESSTQKISRRIKKNKEETNQRNQPLLRALFFHNPPRQRRHSKDLLVTSTTHACEFIWGLGSVNNQTYTIKIIP